LLYSFIVQVDRTQLTLHISSFAYMVYL